MSLIYLELACITLGVLIFLTTHRNSHGCLKSADGDAMLIALEVPARLYPSNKPIAGRFRANAFQCLNVCTSLLDANLLPGTFFFLFSNIALCWSQITHWSVFPVVFGICTLRGTNCCADGSVGNFFFHLSPN